jgi:hypothetical protein
MSCPLNRNRFKGSGYEKKGPECSTALDSQMQDLMAAREAMDKSLAMPHPLFTTAPTPIGPPKPLPETNSFQIAAQQASKVAAQFQPRPVAPKQQIVLDDTAIPCSLCLCKDFFPDRTNRTLCVSCRHPYNNHHPVAPPRTAPVPPGPPAMTRAGPGGPPTRIQDLKVPTPIQKQNHGTYYRY